MLHSIKCIGSIGWFLIYQENKSTTKETEPNLLSFINFNQIVHIHAHEKILWGRGGGGGCHQTVIVNIMRERTANELIYQISHQNDIHITVDETAGKLTKCETFSFHLQIN